jgi:hypothetical protein
MIICTKKSSHLFCGHIFSYSLQSTWSPVCWWCRSCGNCIICPGECQKHSNDATLVRLSLSYRR